MTTSSERPRGLAARWVAFVARAPWALVLVGGVVAALGVLGAGKLRVDTRTDRLLPADSRSVDDLEALRDRLAGDAPLMVLVASDDPALSKRLRDALQERIAAWDDTRWAIGERDFGSLLERRVHYLPAEDPPRVPGELGPRPRAASIDGLARTIEANVEFYECEALPGCVNFDDEPPALPTRDEIRETFRKQPAVAAFERFLGREALADGEGDEAGDDEAATDDLCDGEGVCAIIAMMEGDPGRLAYATKVKARAEALFEEVRPADAPESLRMVVSGRYRNAPLTQAGVASDLRKVTWIGGVLVLLLVLAQLRKLRALVVVFVPLAIGLAASLGAIGALYPSLNLLSAFTLAILFGLGIDFGLHLATAYGERRDAGLVPQEALVEALEELGRSLLVAGLTTGAAFAALAAAELRAFGEMGVLAAVGVFLSLAGFLVFFPPLVLVLHRLRPESGTWLPAAEGLPGAPGRATARRLALGLGALLVLLAVPGQGIGLERDFRKLSPSNLSHGIASRDAVKAGSGLTVYLLADEAEALAELEDVQREADALAGSPSFLLRPGDLVPPADEARTRALARLEEALSRAARRAKGDDVDEVARYQRLVSAPAPTPDDLPPWLGDGLREEDGTYGRVATLQLRMRGVDGEAMERLAVALDEWRGAHPGVAFASADAVLGEILPALRRDAPRLVLLALLGLLLATGLVGRSARRSFLVIAPVALGMGAALGVATLLGWKLHLYNVLVLPIAFGIGVDGAVYVAASLLDGPMADRERRFRTTARAVLGATLTTMAAFGSLMVASNPGIADLGRLALLTIGSCLVTNLLWLPALVRALPTREVS
ncbi:MAG: MMPL family transporter [Myxococcota bacterium]